MLIFGENINEEMVIELGRFTILWNCFEREYCECKCSPKKIKYISKYIMIDKKILDLFREELNNRRHLFEQNVHEYVHDGLYPNNAKKGTEENNRLIYCFMVGSEDNQCAGCLLAINRLRNNLLHGLKVLSELNFQYKLFCAVNNVLEHIERINENKK